MAMKNLLLGGSGITALEITNQIPVPASGDTAEIIKIVLQVVISLATLLGLFKKKRDTNN